MTKSTQQVCVIHGGTSFDTYDGYLNFLRSRDLTLETLQPTDDWKGSLADELGAGYTVLRPRMPNPTNARYEEWCIWFARCAKLLSSDSILIGHSLGGIFLARYLATNTLTTAPAALILVAAPFDDCSTEESLAEFALPDDLSAVNTAVRQIHIFHSEDDPVVPISEAQKYMAAFPQATMHTFAEEGHFNQPTCEELVALIRTCQ